MLHAADCSGGIKKMPDATFAAEKKVQRGIEIGSQEIIGLGRNLFSANQGGRIDEETDGHSHDAAPGSAGLGG
jgi:hypothetical protein